MTRGAERWSIQHFYSIYSDRPLWDRGSSGPLFEPGSERRQRAILAATLPGFPAARLDPSGEFQIKEPLAPIASDAVDAPWRAMTLESLRKVWGAPIDPDEARGLREQVNQWWIKRNGSPWRGNPPLAALLRQASLRVAVPELTDKLRRADIKVGPQIAAGFAAVTSGAHLLAASEQQVVPLCYQHGNCHPGMLGTANGRTYLKGTPTVGLGWWGRDAAQIVWCSYRTGIEDRTILEALLTEVCPDRELRPSVKAWLAIQAVEELAKDQVFSTGRSRLEKTVERLLWLLAAISP